MTLTLRCATDARDYVECKSGTNLAGDTVFIMDVTVDGEDWGFNALSVDDVRRLGSQLTSFINNDASYEIYNCSIHTKQSVDAEEVLDRNNLKVLTLNFHKNGDYAVVNVDKTGAVILASELAMFLVEVELKDTEGNINAGMKSLHRFIVLPEAQKVAVFAKLTGLLYGMNAYSSKKETTQELIDNLHKYLDNPEA